jgi:hypothetical protein
MLQRTYQIAAGATAPDRLYDRARINRFAGEKYLNHHRQLLFRRYLPDIDPRHEPAIMTMMLHMLCIGAVAQRVADGRGDITS